jgi:hypothetical protein
MTSGRQGPHRPGITSAPPSSWPLGDELYSDVPAPAGAGDEGTMGHSDMDVSRIEGRPARGRIITSLLAATALVGCSSTPTEEPPPPAPEPVVEAPAPEPVARPAPPPPVAAAKPVRLAPRHPERYVVKRGDTLWDISATFLEDPWYWPEIWYVNPQIDNPHLIYPGDVISLVYVDGQPRLILERGDSSVVRLSPRVRTEPLEDAILTVPYEHIQAFLSKPAVLDKKTIEEAPYILTTREGHLVHGAGAEVYVRGTDEGVGASYSVMHVGDELRDPDDGDLLGYEGIYVGAGTIQREGDPATMLLNETDREALNGDRLLTMDEQHPLRFTPRAPATPVDGRIIAVTDGVSIVGTYQIVTLNRGSNDGLEPGNVLAVYQAGRVVDDRFAHRGFFDGYFPEKVELPEEYAGHLMVFRTFDEISYGLIVEAESEINVLDVVRNP